MADITMPSSVASTVATPPANNLALYVDSVIGCLTRKDTNGHIAPVAEYTVNVLDFGADPTGTTDSTTAIKNAIAAVGSSTTGVGVVFFPPGNYLVASGPITIGIYCTLLGAGKFLTTITCNQPATDIFDVTQWYVYFEQLTITSPTTAVAAGSNGATISTLTQLLVSSVTGFATSGTITVFNSAGTPQVINYTSVTTGATASFNGCTSSGAGTVATSGVVNQRTGGYAINNASSQAYLSLRDVQIANQYNALQLTGVLNSLEDVVISQTSNVGILVATASAEIVLETVTMNQLPQAVANVEITGCGSCQILDCNFIHGGIDLWLNAGAVGVFSVYAVNTYFDTATTALSCSNTGTISRCQFVGCWFSSQASQGVLLNNATVTGLSFVNCHMHNNASGIVATLALDWAVIGCRISSASAGVGTGVSIAANTSASNFLLSDNIIGANGGFNSFATGISIAAGTYARYIVTGNDLSQNTATLSDSGTATVKSIHDNIGCAVTGAPIIAASAAINTTATILATANCNAGLQPGTTFRITLLGTCTASAADTSTFTVRFGTAGTTADGTIATAAFTSAATGTNIPFKVEIFLTVRTVGSGTSATVFGYAIAIAQGAAGVATGLIAQNTEMIALTDTAFSSLINGILSIGYVSSATTCTATFQNAVIEVVKA